MLNMSQVGNLMSIMVYHPFKYVLTQAISQLIILEENVKLPLDMQ